MTSSYLISITGREQVAKIRGHPIYAIRDVTLIPLSSQAEAETAITKAQKALKQPGSLVAEQTEDSDAGEDAETRSIDEAHETEPAEAAALEPPKNTDPSKSASFLQDVVQNRGKYGPFAQNWFSRSGWTTRGRRRQGMSSEEVLTKEQKKQEAAVLPATEQGATVREEQADNVEKGASAEAPKRPIVIESLAPRILRIAKLYFSASGFFFSYDQDLSRSLTQQDAPQTTVPFWRRFDELFFWNRLLLRPLTDAGQDAYALPLIQGFVGQRAFSIARTKSDGRDAIVEAADKAEDAVASQEQPAEHEDIKTEDLLLTLISRRSVKRAGLRYLRRGVDNSGDVANSVETEQILSRQDWDTTATTFSLLQYRGSIPLFFSQSPYSFKPTPVLFGSNTTNQAAMQRHFEIVRRRYGEIQVACLVDKHGTEVGIGEAYQKHASELSDSSDKKIAFEWFDFHHECKGMKFENVAILLTALSDSLSKFGWSTRQDDRNITQQNGVVRTNCMDCLDRTNVVQSAIGGWALEQQLNKLGLQIDLKSDPKTQWFNTLWADNGDAISRQYAGTAALKGDFTRTRKRNWTGALSDFSLTLNRFYNNIFGDYFLQLNIDYLLGNVGPEAFEEFEADMMGQDYALDMQAVRQNAIDTCIKIVLEDPKEDLIDAWTLSCPKEANTLRTLPFEECVMLLTDVALCFCRFDWDAEKVKSFERVELVDIKEIWRGAYVTSTLGPTHTDTTKNVGFALRYQTSGRAVVRTNTRSLSNDHEAVDENAKKSEVQKQEHPKKNELRLLAFKALPPKSSARKQSGDQQTADMSENELVQHVTENVHKAMVAGARRDHLALDKVPEVQERDIVSVAEARKSTGYMETLGYSLKKLVWS